MEVVQNTPSRDHLPKDMVFEVLTRVSLQTLDQCQLASHEINTFTNQSYFMNLYCERTSTFSGYIVQAYLVYNKYHKFISCGTWSRIEESLSLNFLPEEVIIEALSNNDGLVYCQSSRNHRYYVCKPTTREWVKIKNPKTRFVTCANAMVVLQARPLRYKILRFSKPIRQGVWDYAIFCETFDSAIGVWMRSKDVYFKKHVYLIGDPPIYCKGVIHWITYDGEIFAFNVQKESWKLIRFPDDLLTGCDNIYRKKLVQYEGKLALIDSETNRLDVWVMEDYTRQLWNKKEMTPNRDVVDLYAGDVIVVQGLQGLGVYNCTSQTLTTVDIGKYFFQGAVFPFRSNYETVF